MAIQPWNLVFLAGFIIYVTIRGVFKQRTKGNEITLSRAGALEKLLLALVIPGGLVLPMVYIFTPGCVRRLSPAGVCTMVRHGADDCRAVALLALAFRFGPQLVAGAGAAKGTPDREAGGLSPVRHPMYASIWVWCVAQGLLLDNWLAGWYAGVAFAIMYFVRTPREERMMCEAFGDEYREYMRQTGVPRISRIRADH